MKKGKLIVFEGLDGSGKTTQLNLLKKYLEKNGKHVETLHFPRHREKFFGVVVDDYLNGKFGDATKVHPYLASVLYACDRWEVKEKMDNWLNDDAYVLLDRYATSNQGHQVGKLKTDAEKIKCFEWIDEMEYRVFKIPVPDQVFYLDVPFEYVAQLMSSRGGKDKEYIEGEYDQHESDEQHLRDTTEAYRFVSKRKKYWYTIECINEDREMFSPEHIHKKITKFIKL